MSEHVGSKGIYGKTENEVRRDLIREMNRVGAYRLDGQYSGGHDEGGLDELQVFDKDDGPIDTTSDTALWQAVEDLLSTKFYTWALKCSVYGRVYVDLKAKRAWTEGYEEVMREEDDTDPIDWSW